MDRVFWWAPLYGETIILGYVENMLLHCQWKMKQSKSVSLKQHSVSLFIEMNLKRQWTWWKYSCLMTDWLLISFLQVLLLGLYYSPKSPKQPEKLLLPPGLTWGLKLNGCLLGWAVPKNWLKMKNTFNFQLITNYHHYCISEILLKSYNIFLSAG